MPILVNNFLIKRYTANLLAVYHMGVDMVGAFLILKIKNKKIKNLITHNDIEQNDLL